MYDGVRNLLHYGANMAKETGQNRVNRVFSRVFGDKTWLKDRISNCKEGYSTKETTIK